MRYLSILACGVLMTGLLGCAARNASPEETPGQTPPHDTDMTGRPNINKVIVTEVGESARGAGPASPAPSPAPVPAPAEAAQPEPATPAPTPAAEPDAAAPATEPEAPTDEAEAGEEPEAADDAEPTEP
jgi:hypothetical protein